jgi:osmotically-inducible protein OsmY
MPTEVPDDLVDVKVQDGWLTLSGDVTYQFESNAAYDDVTTLQGVVGITNEIKVITP